MWFEFRSSLASLGLLRRRLGLSLTWRVVRGILRRQRSGEPWDSLPPSEDEQERLSRQQAGPAILLYRALQEELPSKEALDLTAEIILQGSLLFLRQQIPILRAEKILALSHERRLQWIRSLTESFFNADVGDLELSSQSFRYLVVRCRFPELLQATGHPELAPLFCQGDLLFFQEEQPDVDLERPTTLAADQSPCDFRFTLRASK